MAKVDCKDATSGVTFCSDLKPFMDGRKAQSHWMEINLVKLTLLVVNVRLLTYLTRFRHNCSRIRKCFANAPSSLVDSAMKSRLNTLLTWVNFWISLGLNVAWKRQNSSILYLLTGRESVGWRLKCVPNMKPSTASALKWRYKWDERKEEEGEEKLDSHAALSGVM